MHDILYAASAASGGKMDSFNRRMAVLTSRTDPDIKEAIQLKMQGIVTKKKKSYG